MSARKCDGGINIGYRIALLVGVLLLICSFAACGSSSSSLVGKWYNEKGKCLDIRSDSSWKLEDSYGTGTWKNLDDGIFEFTDFYGDTQESEINEDERGLYIDFGYYGNFYKDSYPSGNNVAVNNATEDLDVKSDEEQYPIDKVYCYSQGLAWVRYTNATEERYALVDVSGVELYSFCADYADIEEIKGGLSSFKARKGDVTNYYLINSEGRIIASTENGDFDNVLAYGDGLALLYKYEGGMQSSKHLYGVLDKNGNWLHEYRDLGCDPCLDNQYFIHSYIGDGVFAIDRGSNGDYLFFNSYEGKVIYLYNSEKDTASFSFVNGCTAVLFDKYWVDPIVSQIPLESIYGTDEIESPFLLRTDGTYVLLEDFDIEKDSVSGGFVIRDKGEYLELYNYTTGESAQVKKYTQLGTTLKFYDDYGVLITMGQDKNKYFTLVKKDGTPLYEPICGTAKYYWEGYIAYKSGDLWYICGPDGNLIMEEIYKIGDLEDGIVEVQLSEDSSYIYMDLDGKQLFTTVYMQ